MKRCYDGIIGLALADAMGVPVEFFSRKELKKHPVLDFESYGTYGMPEGCWSDDTSLTIATMDGIIKNSGVIDEQAYKKIADNFVDYYYDGAFTPTDKMFDIGGTTSSAIFRYASGEASATEAGGNAKSNAGNGALMRILPIAYYAYDKDLPDDKILDIVSNIASITHRLETCKLGSYIYTQYAKKLLEGFDRREAYEIIQELDYSFFSQETLEEYSRILEDDISRFPEDEISSLGKTCPTLEATLWSFMNSHDYSDAILTAINLGNDTDTVGACTGGLAGLYYGCNDISPEWLSKLKKLEYLTHLCDNYDLAIARSISKEDNDREI